MTRLPRYAIALLAVCLGAAVAMVGWQRTQMTLLRADVAAAQAQAIAAGFEASAARADVKIVTTFVDRVRTVYQTTHDLQREVPRYVPPSTDATYPLPVGFVRLHDAAATSTMPGAPGDTDAQASTVTASAAAAVIADNYGTCNAIREQLNAILDREQALRRGAEVEP